MSETPAGLTAALSRRWIRYTAAVVLVACTSALAEMMFRTLGTTRVSPVFLAGVVIAAVYLGSGPAYLTALLSFGVYNFYLSDPRFSLSLSPENVVILTVFLMVALMTGRLAGRLRDHERQSTARSRSQGILLEASRDFAGALSEQGIREALARHLAVAAQGEAGILGPSGQLAAPFALTTAPLELSALAGRMQQPGAPLVTSALGAWFVRPLEAGGERLGAAAWRPTEDRRIQADPRMLELLVDLGANSLLRARLSEERSGAEAVAKTERLQSTLLSSLSHDLRTPLASILASTGSLQEFGEQMSSAQRADLVSTIEEEAERLNLFVDNLLSMSRLEAGALKVRAEPVDLHLLGNRVVHRCRSRQRSRRLVKIGFEGRRVLGDPILLEQALTNVLENAYRFSPDGSVVEMSALDSAGAVVIEVADEGPGVPSNDLQRIFDKFYRCAMSEKVPGTGLGLSITKGLIEAMGGAVDARPGVNGRGLCVRLTLQAAS